MFSGNASPRRGHPAALWLCLLTLAAILGSGLAGEARDLQRSRGALRAVPSPSDPPAPASNAPSAGGAVAIVRNFDNPEIAALQGYPMEMGISSQVFDQEGLTAAQLSEFGLVIYDDLGHADGGLTDNDVSVFMQLRDAGKPLYFIGDDLAYATLQLSPFFQVPWTTLTHLRAGDNAGGDGTVRIVNASHPVIDGPSGIVHDFAYEFDPDAVEQAGFGEVLLAKSGSHDVLIAYENTSTGGRLVTQNVLAYNGGTGNSVNERKTLFKNAVAWLMRRSTGGTIDVRVFDASPEDSGGVFLPLNAYTATAQRQTLASGQWTGQARMVSKAAADGVTLLLVRAKLPAGYRGRVSFSLEGSGALGSVWPDAEEAGTPLLDRTATGGARDQAPNQGPVLVSVPAVKISEERYAFALYRSPRDFDVDESTHALGERRVTLVTRLLSGSPSETRTELTIVRPLVILIHGTWDNPDGWNGFPLYQHSAKQVENYAPPTGDPQARPFSVGRAGFDLIWNASGHMADNAATIRGQLLLALLGWRNRQGVAATQMDVVTHSYGGPVTRLVVQTQPDSNPLTAEIGENFRNSWNWGHGSIHKLITVAGSHRGSHMANHTAYLNRNSGNARRGLANTGAAMAGRYIDKGALADQFVLSPALRALRQTRVPAHAILGSALVWRNTRTSDPEFKEQAAFVALQTADRPDGFYNGAGALTTGPPGNRQPNYPNWRRLLNFVFNLDYNLGGELGLDPNYDFTVDSWSATGGLPRQTYSTVMDLDPSGALVGKLTHLGMRASPEVSDRVEFLLKQKVLSGLFEYFPATESFTNAHETTMTNYARPEWLQDTWGIGAPRRGAARPAAGPQVTTNAVGGRVVPGQELQVTVAWSGKTISGLALSWTTPGPSGYPLAPVETQPFTLVVPDGKVGPFNITAWVGATDGSFEPGSIDLTLADTQPYSAVRVVPAEVTLNTLAREPLYAYGRRADGTWRDITGLATITSSNPGIASIAEGRLVQAVGFGTTSLNVATDAGMVEVPVTVEAAPVGAMAVLKGRNPRLKRTSTKATPFAFLSSPGFDARMLAAQTMRVNGLAPVPQRGGALGIIKDVNRDRLPDVVVKVRPVDLGLTAGTATIRLSGATQGGTLVGGDAVVNVR